MRPISNGRLAGLGEAEGRDDARVGDGDRRRRRRRGLARELLAHGDARVVDGEVVEHAVGAGEVDVLEHAEAPGLAAHLDALQAVLVDDEDLAGGDVADLLGLDQVEGAGLGGDNVALGAGCAGGRGSAGESRAGRGRRSGGRRS
jgi:hypothetical protein